MPEKCTKTLLIPAVIVVLLVLIINTIQKFNLAKIFSAQETSNSGSDTDVDVDESLTLANPAVAYNVLQCGAYASMALMIMRLKLFFVPQLCILASFLGNEKVRLVVPHKVLVW